MTHFQKRETIRCPFCVEQGAFKAMAEQPGGDWYVCQNCGHLALPANPGFRCTCSRCSDLDKHNDHLAASHPNTIKRRVEDTLRKVARRFHPPDSLKF